MKRIVCALVSVFTCLSAAAGMTGCSGGGGGEITVVSREEGSGTRGAFIELFGIEAKGDDGSKKDLTTKEAVITDKTSVMLTNVAGDENAVGYVSLGSLNDTVKALDIDGVKATADNVKNGSYKIVRPFNIAVKGEPGDLKEPARDFIGFILSSDGQAVVGNNYIPIDEGAGGYAGNMPAGKIVVAGSSSVTPVMEKLREAYLEINKNAAIEIQQTDSTSGMNAAMAELCDIGMASRELKESELAALSQIPIALDGVAVIVNKGNTAQGLTKGQVKDIFTGSVHKWEEVK